MPTIEVEGGSCGRLELAAPGSDEPGCTTAVAADDCGVLPAAADAGSWAAAPAAAVAAGAPAVGGPEALCCSCGAWEGAAVAADATAADAGRLGSAALTA